MGTAIAGSRAGGYGRPPKLAKYKCTSCSHHYEEQPGSTICPKCQCKYVYWVNAQDWEIAVAQQDAQLAIDAKWAADDAIAKAKAAILNTKASKKRRKAAAKARKRKK